MNFTMVMIICFSAEVSVTAIFDDTKFSSYDECYESSRSAVSFMAEMYPDSSGEIRCLNWRGDGNLQGIHRPRWQAPTDQP